ncbi:MOXD1 2 [Folsomia candida]|uniref:MOXD1 2 n=2 Tax=Folsomia candida TaxID=158441 RepID=A0A226EJM9_FOLCA|nr:MOXD1 2 [Folsomia candida]
MRIRHFRGNSELPWIINDENYDFNYQTNRRLPKPVTILPGDQITAECVYDTNWKGGKSVIGGQSTDDEMCMVFIAYYPEIPNFVGCYDWMNKFNMYKILGVETVDNPTGKDPVVTSPAWLQGMNFSTVVSNFNWTEEARREYQWQQQFGEHVTACLPQINAVTGYYPMVERYVEERGCPKGGMGIVGGVG